MNKETVLTEAMIGELLDVIHNVLLVIDSEHNIIFANSRTEKMFDTAPDSLLGKSFSSLFVPEDTDILVKNILAINRTDREIESEAMFVKKDGSTFLGRISGTCFTWDNGQVGMVFSIHDISDMKAIEQSLKHSERIAFLGRLVDDISHQIRNPIVAIAGSARRLQTRHGVSDNLEIILRESTRLEKLLNSMNRFARLPRPKLEKICFRELLDQLDSIAGSRVKEFGCSWFSSCDEKMLKAKLPIDKRLFLDAVIDVVENACESYSQMVGSEDREDAESRPVRCEIVPGEDDTFPFILKIVDSGSGITDHGRDQVFSHFYTDKTGHIGMGLTFARRIIEDQGGLMTIESKQGLGTTVNIHLLRERRRDLRTMRLS